MDLTDLQGNACEAASFLKQLANESRLMILCALAEGELSVGELNEQVPLSQSALSQHLASLRRSGLVATRREAQNIYYRLQGDSAVRVIALLKELFCPVE
ncbi:metalloregulator ArsR/SmtB family transcription factor [Pseudomaricurvus sp. HS19]|nr:metalloregulator ArsR/SmtB family transcription factor [Pseudomaricurvus sp. HS19]